MKLDILAGSGNDEFYTPKYAVMPIVEYLKPNSVVWCPFDTLDSNYVKTLTSLGHTVVLTHISDGVDFLTCKPVSCDFIISNPPYSLKTEVLERLFSLNTRFAMLVGVVGLFESKRRFNLFKNNQFECLYLDKRVSFLKDYASNKTEVNPPFSSIYICSGILPSKFVFKEINKKDI